MGAINKKKKSEFENIDEAKGQDLITEPFDPNDIKIDVQHLTIQHILERLEYNEINLMTEYQRLPNLWKEDKKSQLIESILLNLPLPSFYFDGKDDGKWEVIDGLQRVSTIKHFILGNQNEKGELETFKLKGLEFLKNFEGKKYKDLSRDQQRRIKSFKISVYVVQKGTPDVVKYNLFKRINTAGLELTPQEIRHALNQGRVTGFVHELAELPAFRQATDNSVKSDRMQDRDLVTRFLAFYLLGLDAYHSDLDGYMNKAMAQLNNPNIHPENSLTQLKNTFEKAMNVAFQIFEKDAFRKRENEEHSRRQINKALFDSVSVSLAQLSDNQQDKLVENKEFFKKRLMEETSERGAYWKAITTSTGGRTQVFERFDMIKKLIEESLVR